MACGSGKITGEVVDSLLPEVSGQHCLGLGWRWRWGFREAGHCGKQNTLTAFGQGVPSAKERFRGAKEGARGAWCLNPIYINQRGGGMYSGYTPYLDIPYIPRNLP